MRTSGVALDMQMPAILVIDMHRGHLDRRATFPCPRGSLIIPRLTNLLHKARKLAIPIIHVAYEAVDGIHNTHPFWTSKIVKTYPNVLKHNLQGSHFTEFVVRPEATDYVIDNKRTYSPFMYTDLELYLKKLQVDALAIAGVMSEVCCLCTAFEAFNRHFKVVAIRDCQAGESPSAEAAAYNLIDRHIGWVVTAEQFLRYAERAASRERSLGAPSQVSRKQS